MGRYLRLPSGPSVSHRTSRFGNLTGTYACPQVQAYRIGPAGSGTSQVPTPALRSKRIASDQQVREPHRYLRLPSGPSVSHRTSRFGNLTGTYACPQVQAYRIGPAGSGTSQVPTPALRSKRIASDQQVREPHRYLRLPSGP